MREQERYCAIQLRDYLVSQGINAAFTDGSDPPDVEFQVGDQRWAVEHTQLFQYVDRKGVAESRMRIDTINLKFEDRLLARTNDQRKSSWVLALHGVADATMRRDIEDSATQCILSDSLDAFSKIPSKVAELRNIPDSKGRILVLSILPSGSKVPNSNRYSADIQATVNYAVQQIFRKKAEALSKFSEYDRRVLLIQSQYMFLNLRNLKRAVIEHASLKSGIDKVFLVTPTEVGEVN